MTNKNNSGSFGSSRGLLNKIKKDKKRKSSSTRWIGRQLNDPYVLETQKRGYKSRAAFKLLQINDKFNFLLPGLSVIDLGCAPGGWLQIASEKVSSITGNEKVIGVDILKTDDIAGCKSIIGDINDKAVGDHLIELLGQKPDIVLSDMAVNTTGNKNLDSIQTSELCLDAMHFSKDVLKNDGKFISKIFVGSTFNEIIAESKKIFKKSKVFKPNASRKESKESFIICSMLR